VLAAETVRVPEHPHEINCDARVIWATRKRDEIGDLSARGLAHAFISVDTTGQLGSGGINRRPIAERGWGGNIRGPKQFAAAPDDGCPWTLLSQR